MSMTHVIFVLNRGKQMNRRLFHISLLAMAFGIVLLSPLTAVFADSQWTLTVSGDVTKPLTLTVADLAAMPTTTEYAELHCYYTLVASGDWTGVRLGLLLEQAGYNLEAVSVEFHASDGYQINLETWIALRDDVIVAYQLNDQALPEVLRLVIPGANGNLWIAMITSITVDESPSLISPTNPGPMPTPTPTPPPPQPSTPPPQQLPTSPTNQTDTQPNAPPAASQPVHQISSNSDVPAEYAYPVIFAAIAATVAAAAYVIHDRRK
jgi:hypothetical protein